MLANLADSKPREGMCHDKVTAFVERGWHVIAQRDKVPSDGGDEMPSDGDGEMPSDGDKLLLVYFNPNNPLNTFEVHEVFYIAECLCTKLVVTT